MKRISLDYGWKFREGTLDASYYSFERAEDTVCVDLPHDFTIARPPKPDCPEGDACGYFASGIGTYMTYFEADASMAAGDVLLELDGASCNAEVTINAHPAGLHPNAYTPWHFDLSAHIKEGKNRLAVFVCNMGRNTRWYQGTGIYRHAWLRVGGKVHLQPEPVFLTTTALSAKQAIMHATVYAKNNFDAEKKLIARIILRRDCGRGVPAGEEVARGESVFTLPARTEGETELSFVLPDPATWSPSRPALYRAEVQLFEEDTLLDHDEVLCGVRTFALDRARGLLLNGESVKLRGGCVHHDNGLLGAASFYDSEYRRLRLHKENGFNAIRCAHNPMSADFMEACDRLGLIVLAEAFDMWAMQKNANDYHLFFPDWWERDLTAFLRRDRNHPCVFAWSIGNEIVERNGLEGGAFYAQKLAAKVRELDPTRFVTSGVPIPFNGLPDDDMERSIAELEEAGSIIDVQNKSTSYWQNIFLERTETFTAPLDFVGYNYLDMRYEEDLAADSEKFICGTESYPCSIADLWEKVKRLPRLLGDFVWTSWEYIGEVWIGMCFFGKRQPQEIFYPYRLGGCSCFDLLGNERPSLAFRRVVWGSRESYISVLPPDCFDQICSRSPWAWDGTQHKWYFPGQEGRRTRVDVYSSAECVELYLNGEKIAEELVGAVRKNVAQFEVCYLPGTLVAVSLDGREERSHDVLTTPAAPAAIRLLPEQEELYADGQSLAYVGVEIVDRAGNVVPVDNILCHATADGEARLIGFGSARSDTEEGYMSGTFTCFEGKLLAILRAGTRAGRVVLTVRGEGLPAAQCTLSIKEK